MNTLHQQLRGLERGIQLPPEAWAAMGTGTSYAIRLGRTIGRRDSWTTSSGEWRWAIVRGGNVTTVMYRRGEQPCRPQDFSVERVVYFR